MRALILFLLVVGLSLKTLAQDLRGNVTIIAHEVKYGETIRMLSLKYLVTPNDIYKLNRFALDGISQGMVLQIPTYRKVKINGTTLEVDEVRANSPVPGNDPIPVAESLVRQAPIGMIAHTVVAKETLYSISKKYDISVEEIKRQNPAIVAHGLQAGQVIKIKPNK